VVMAWADRDLVPVEIEGAVPRRTGNVLWFLPSDMAVKGKTTFRQDLIRNTVISTDAAFFNKDPFNFNFGRGTVELAYHPIPFKGQLHAKELRFGFNFGDIGVDVPPQAVQPLESVPPVCGNPPQAGCAAAPFDGLPDIELYDRSGSVWRQLPHLAAGARYAVADPANYVDPGTGSVLVRLLNPNNDSVGFSMDVAITGDVE